MRFAAMDTNNDGVISRAEWRGSDVSFRGHDWNGDGRLSGDEVRPGARRQSQTPTTGEFEGPDREYEFDNWTPEGFTGLDHNKDGRITRDEWHFAREGFRRADYNNDGSLTRLEFLGSDTAEDDDREHSFRDLDENRDGRISRQEWHGTRARFDALDDNRDGALSRAEAAGSLDPPNDLFTSLDVNRDRGITEDEWHWSRQGFAARDANRDGRLTREEFAGTTAATADRGAAYRAGAERGLIEGRAAGREDRERNQGWDLEGQRELETADSGYDARFGPRAEYQAGYRDAFR
ncbi:MAG TPA: hypothetical protein VM493_06270, partial [Vicinamibacterales bacterium]|nr:hypothetical protein [Vicinamibacterales bacterium]